MADSPLSPTESRTDKHFEAGEKPYTEQIEQEEVPSKKPSFGSKAKRHCARFWWLHLIIFCASFLIIALCLTYVAMPKIAQKGVSEATVEVTDLEFRQPTNVSLVITQKAILHSPSIYTPTLDPFNASFWLVTNGEYASEPMLNLSMAQIHALHPQSTTSIENQFVEINSLEQVTAFSTAVLTQETVITAMTGRTRLHEGALPVNWVTFNTTITQKGLNGLKGFNVTDVRLNSTAFTGPNLHGNAVVPNPSSMTIEMGNVTMILSTPSQGVIGNSTINDMTLVPGTNTLPMSATINQTAVIASLDSNGYITMEIVGKYAVRNGIHLTYYEQALASNTLSLQMNVKQILADSAKV